MASPMDATPAELAELKSVFKAECDEHVAALDSLLLKLEQTPDNALVLQETFRRVHSVKGAARMVGYTGLESVAHAMETMLAGSRDGRQSITPSIISALFEGADAIGDLVRTDGGRSDGEARVRNALERILLLSGDAAEIPTQGQSTAATPRVQPATGGDVVRVNTQKVDALLSYPGELMRELVSEEREFKELTNALETLLTAADHVRLQSDEQRRHAALEHLLSLTLERREPLHGTLAQMAERNVRRARALEELRFGLSSLGMLPVQTVLSGMPRLARDTAVAQGKRVELQVSGAEVEIGKSVLDKLMEPLIQLVKNAIAHGIETPERRMAHGKNPVGTVRIAVTTSPSSATIAVQDDGEGIDLARIREVIVAEGEATDADAAAMPEQRLISYLFRPGFSTSERTDAISGRGVGLDIVAERVKQLRGTYRLENQPGRGLGFFLTVPVNLLWSSILSLRAGAFEACLRLADIREATILRPSDIIHIDNHLCATVRGEAMPLLPLTFVGGGDAEITFGLDGEITVLIVEYGERRAAFAIDALQGVSDVIVKTLPKPLAHLPGIAGYAVLASGDPICVLDGQYLVEAAYEYSGAGRIRHLQPTAKRSLLIVEDSMTTRTLLRNIMISAGYAVDTAVDGADGWAKVQQQRYDCVVSDIEMPNMNGWDLCARVKRESRFADIPFVLITSLSKDAERRRGLELGADAYMVKGLFNEQELLDTVERLIA
ncbi:MAG: response regulator [Candidatus Eremiobacteraeota bacterium]|nr:response regulator [Candidatus Eremiobacteraeota bacterium]